MKKSNLFVKFLFGFLLIVSLVGFAAPNIASAKQITCDCGDYGGGVLSDCNVPWYRGCRYCCSLPVLRTSSPDSVTDGRLSTSPSNVQEVKFLANDLSSLVNSVSGTTFASGSTSKVGDLSGLLYSLGFFNPTTNTTTGDLVIPTSVNSTLVSSMNNLASFFGLSADSKFDSTDYNQVSQFSGILGTAVSKLPSNVQTLYVVGRDDTVSSFSSNLGVFGHNISFSGSNNDPIGTSGNPKGTGTPTTQQATCCTEGAGCEGDFPTMEACKAVCDTWLSACFPS